jgi:carotenoid 1,2-hydratase
VTFARPVPAGGYAWWYVDAVSDCGTQAITLIAFIGSVFSPYYAWANRKAPAPAENFCAMNIAIYNRTGGAWAMTERNATKFFSRPEHIHIGPSNLHWDGSTLNAHIHEITAPIPRRLRGAITLTTTDVQNETFTLDAAGRHRWRPIAPAARVVVNFDSPKLSWSGQGYFDTNDGDRPLAEDFSSWHWSRAATDSGATVMYDVTRTDGTEFGLALDITAGQVTHFTPPPEQTLPRTLWRIPRRIRADAGFAPHVIKTLEDAPFYARSRIATRINGAALDTVHETLDLNRFTKPIVQAMLPFRMPRRF